MSEDTGRRTQQFRYAVWLANEEGKTEQAIKEMTKVVQKGEKSAFYQEQVEARDLLDQWQGEGSNFDQGEQA